ncbi:MAG: hypothetical protein ACOCTU_02015, partial [Bacteroidota bacterium]
EIFERIIQACGKVLGTFIVSLNGFFFQLHETFNIAGRQIGIQSIIQSSRSAGRQASINSTPIQLSRFISSFLDFTFSFE